MLRVLERAGFVVKRQKGISVIMRREEPFAQIVLPLHASPDTGTLAVIGHQAGLTAEEFQGLR